ncbi:MULTISPECIES: hypothetical protein [unclassified Streptomyces]|uniref:hypothetical protein n=1 Tax=Streptomyces sp. NPDC127129 TaxID=3345373 RepID=UPI00362757F8
MSGRRRLDWLGLTPEPERELPTAVAALRASVPGAPTRRAEDLAAAERRRVERLVLRGSRHSWLRYLAEVTSLVTGVATGSRPGDPAAALLAGEVVLDHHRMLIGLPGPGYGRTAGDRAALEGAVRTLRGRTRASPPSGTDAPTRPSHIHTGPQAPTRTGGSSR